MGNKFQVLIAEDQSETRMFMKKLIPLLHPSFEVIDEAVDGEELLDKVFTLRPDLIFVDIEMPKMKGIDAIRECIKVKHDLKFVFTTAHDTFALEAFKLKAMDYIVKPVSMDRLYDVLKTAAKILTLEGNVGNLQTNVSTIKRIPIRFNRSLYYVPLDDILFIEKQSRKSIIHTIKEEFSTYETLEDMKEYLDDRFYQSHRSFIINLAKVYEIKSSGQSFLVYFDHYQKPAQIAKNNIKVTQQQIERFIK